MTPMEKSLATLLVSLTEKTINLEDNQAGVMRIISAVLPCEAKDKQFLLDAVARVETSSDQTRASLAVLKASLKL